MASATCILVPSLLIFSSCSSPQKTSINLPDVSAPTSSQAPGPRAGQKPIEPGEVLDVFVMEDDAFSGRFLLRSSGDIILPKVGRVTLAGKTLREAESTIKARLESNQLTTATVLVDRAFVEGGREAAAIPQTIDVYVSGNVQRPGRITLPIQDGRQPTAFQAVLEAGGFGKFANERKVSVIRPVAGGQTSTVEIDMIAVQRGQSRDIPLGSGDVVMVPEKLFGF